MSTTNLVIDTDNYESLSRITYPLTEMLKCFLIAIKTNSPNAAAAIFSERFIAYVPDQLDNLDNIDFSSFIIGNGAKRLIDVYDDLLNLWKELQSFGLIGSDYHPDFKAIEHRIQKNLDDLTALI